MSPKTIVFVAKYAPVSTAVPVIHTLSNILSFSLPLPHLVLINLYNILMPFPPKTIPISLCGVFFPIFTFSFSLFLPSLYVLYRGPFFFNTFPTISFHHHGFSSCNSGDCCCALQKNNINQAGRCSGGWHDKCC